MVYSESSVFHSTCNSQQALPGMIMNCRRCSCCKASAGRGISKKLQFAIQHQGWWGAISTGWTCDAPWSRLKTFSACYKRTALATEAHLLRREKGCLGPQQITSTIILTAAALSPETEATAAGDIENFCSKHRSRACQEHCGAGQYLWKYLHEIVPCWRLPSEPASSFLGP